MELESNNHSVFLMHYHLVLVVKYRRRVITDAVSDRAREIFERIAPTYGITLEEWNHDVDHVHMLFRAQPKTELSKFICAYKSASSRLLKKEFHEIRRKLCHECGYRFSGTKDLSVREWTCPLCGRTHDRDVNAARNIRDEGMRLALSA